MKYTSKGKKEKSNIEIIIEKVKRVKMLSLNELL